MPLPRRTFLLTLAAAAVLSGCGAPPALAAAGRLVDLQIVDRGHDDAVLAQYRHRGQAYVAGRPGDRYAVRLTNRSGGRVLVVLSIDGVNAVSGETAATGQTGYVLAPWQSADIAGWRKSDAESAAFYFTALPDSYAARTGRPQNVGVIGAAVFRERAPQPLPRPFESGAVGGRDEGDGRQAMKSQAPAGAAAARERDAAPATARNERLGTGHGEREYAPITRTSFERASDLPAEVVQLRYDSRANLVASGVIAPRQAVPEPFPGYVPDPWVD